MLLARVEGHATATFKHASLRGRTLLVVQPMRCLTLEPVIAIDPLGAARGDLVLISSDGLGARELLADETSPARWTVMGIIDECAALSGLGPGANETESAG